MTRYPIEQWQAAPLPYCVTRYSKSQERHIPLGRRRFASVEDALAHIRRIEKRHERMLFVDYAGAHA